MRFQRYLRLPNQWARNHDSMVSIVVNSDEARWSIGKNDFVPIISEGLKLPKKFCVRAKIVPIPIAEEERKVLIEVMINSDRLKPYKIYGDNDHQLANESKHQAVEFRLQRFVDNDDWFKKREDFFQCGLLVARRDFCVQQQDVFVHSVTDPQTNETIITPPGTIGGRALWPYGGYYRQGCGLEKIEQIVFAGGAQKWFSDISLKRGSEWVAHGVLIDGSINQEGCFMQDMQKHVINTKTWFEIGEAKLSVPIGVDDYGNKIEIVYESCAVQQTDEISEIYEITFKKEDNLCPLF